MDKKYLKRAKKIVKLLCGNNHKINMELIGDEYTDPVLYFDNSVAILWEDGSDTDDPNFQVAEVITDPGTRNEPPSEDFDVLFDSPSDFDWCVLKAVLMVMERRLIMLKEDEQLLT